MDETEDLRRRVAELEVENRALRLAAAGRVAEANAGPTVDIVRGRGNPEPEAESRRARQAMRQARSDAVLAAADYEGAIAAGKVDLALAQALNRDLLESRAALHHSEQQLHLILESAVEYAIFTMDLAGRITTWNEGARRILGYKREEIVGRRGHIIFTPEDLAAGCPEAEMKGALSEGRAADERWHVREDGSRFWAQGMMMPLQHDGAVHGFLKILRDRTEERRAEQALEASNRNLRVLADAIPQLAWTADPGGWISWYNQRWYDYTGMTLEEMKGYGWRSVHHPEHIERVEERYRRSMETGEPWEDTFPLLGRHGTYRWFLSRALPVRDSEGRITLWFGTNTDITEQREAEAALAEAVQRQEMLTREISHRVKNSLQMVASLLRMQASVSRDPEAKSAILDAVARVATIAQVHDRLWRQQDLQAVDMAGFLNDLCADLQQVAPSCRIVIPEIPHIAIPTDRAIPLGLIVNELVTNAFKHGCPAGGGEVHVRLEAPGGTVRLEVSDRGHGLPEGFDPRGKAGSLGMRLISGFVRQLNGTLDVSSAKPGARFVIEMPLN